MTRRLDYIDALRGIAAVTVLFQHILEMIWGERPQNEILASIVEWFLFEAINLGRFGVVVFFLISGLVIPFSFKGNNPLSRFCITRFFRIYPAYWVSILIALISYKYTGSVFSIETIAANLTMLQRIMIQPDIQGVYWTLFFELLFYFVCFLLYWRGLLCQWKILVVCSLILILVATIPSIFRYGFNIYTPSPESPIYLAYMFTGTVVRHGLIGNRNAARWGVTLLVLLASSAVVLSGLIFRVPANANPFLAASPIFNAHILAIMMFYYSFSTQKSLNPIFIYLGTISYSLYLNQASILNIMTILVPLKGGSAEALIFIIIAFAATISISAVIYNFVERPCIRLGRAISDAQERAAPKPT